MNTNLRATSLTLRDLLRERLRTDINLRDFFDPGRGGNMVVTLLTPEELAESGNEGLSVWLYRIERDEFTLNQSARRPARDRLLHVPLPLKLHYLLTPIVDSVEHADAPELEQNILGVAMQTMHDHALLAGVELRGDLAGTDIELHVRLEGLDLDQMSRVWDALEGSFQLCISYEVAVVPIDSARQPDAVAAVDVVLPSVGANVSTEGAP